MTETIAKPRRVTLADVAKRAGVSVSTVSAVLGDRPHCYASQATRQAVFDAADAMGYRPNLLARGLRSESTRTVGLMLPVLDRGAVAGGKLQSLEDTAWTSDYRLIIATYKNDAARLRQGVEECLGRHVDGIVFWGVDQDHAHVVDEARRAGVAVVTVEAEAPINAPDVAVDREAGTYLTMRHLLELGRRPALLFTMHDCLSGRRKVEGVRRAAGEFGRDLDDFLVLEVPQPVGSASAAGAEMAARLLEQREAYDAVLTFSDDVAAGVVATFSAAGVRVPHDVAVAGFDGSYAPEAMVIPITTVEQPRGIGAPVFDLLLDQMAGGPAGADRSVMLEPRLCVRESTVAGAGLGAPGRDI